MIKNDTTLTFRVYRKDLETNKITLTLETTDHESCLNHMITMLYDKAIKRNSLKIRKYFENDKEYCYLEQKILENNASYYYIVTGIRCDWGNFINMTKTINDNNIVIK